MYCSTFPLLPYLCFSLAWSIKHPWHLVLTLVAGGSFWQLCIFCIYSSPEILLSIFSLIWGIMDFSKLPSIPSVLYVEQDCFPQSLRANSRSQRCDLCGHHTSEYIYLFIYLYFFHILCISFNVTSLMSQKSTQCRKKNVYDLVISASRNHSDIF